jgi:lipopolysaccharide export system protein LptC
MRILHIDKWLVVAVVIALSTLSWWMPVEQRPMVAALVTGPEKRHIADYDLTDFDLTTMNAAGRPRYYLQARSLRHYADDDTSEVSLPRLTIFRQGGASPWFVRAEQALVTAGAETVFLQDQVKLERLTEDKGDKLEILTPALKVVPAKEYAETDQPVTIVTALGVTRAVGMQADLKQKHLELLAQVRGEYAKQ